MPLVARRTLATEDVQVQEEEPQGLLPEDVQNQEEARVIPAAHAEKVPGKERSIVSLKHCNRLWLGRWIKLSLEPKWLRKKKHCI